MSSSMRLNSIGKIYVDHGISGAAGTAVWVAVRPEKMVINTAPLSGEYNHARGKVEEIAYIGGLSVYHVKTQSGMTIRATLANVDRLGRRPVSPGMMRSILAGSQALRWC